MAYTTIDDPEAYFETKLYVGNGGTQNITGLDFAPNWVWLKDRTNANSGRINDTVRTATKYLIPSTTGTEATESAGLTSFNSDGFSLGSNSDFNGDTANFVSWNWKAGTSASGDTSGSGTAKTFSSSSSSTAGFSIVKYVGNGTTNHAIPHGCGTAPKMIIVKTTTKSSQAWPVDCRQVGGVMYLDETGAAGAYGNDNPFTSVAPTSSVFSVGSPGNTNYNDDTYIAYCFAEKQGYSKFGSYVGNGNADGTFVYTGFRPAWVIIKQSSASGNQWNIIDNKRDIDNPVTEFLLANTNGAEVTYTMLDFLSNGFKLRTVASNFNATTTYVYMAFAESPFVNSNGVPNNAR